MSMKSFDKFCEKMILAEPSSQKEIFDERQNVMRSRLAIEALLIYVGLTVVNSMVMEIFYQWAESWMTVMMLFMVICLAWWSVRCAVKGCLLPVSGREAQKYSAVISIFVGALNMLRYIFNIGEEDYFVKNGRLTGDFVFALSFLLLICVGIFILCVMRREEKQSKDGE
ncbi:MAG: hypothetical protein NC299_06375 [Lachnospiraceae bacterium]|nr:hypothetical protein [Ruminococcus sp.]MCM1274980.1 hypothetical protein [Lachnospiraceae bacterium]